MKLPRRVPWSSLAELDEVCNWIYSDESDSDAKLRAINRLSAWRAITALPHALDAVLSLVSSVILDERYIDETQRPCDAGDRHSNSPTIKNSLALSVRQSYATAIVRLVNGLVDPLQLGTYARSIASIAVQIGLPQWLVELRHAATHEDLPSLEVLRTGARESLTWFLYKYFLPTLSASCVEESRQQAVQISPINPLLMQYKSIMKTISRDASLKTQYRDDLARTLRDIERWVGEAKVVSSAAIFNGWGVSEPSDGEEENERWALERFCDALIERGGLVPVSSRKRLTSNLKSPPVLPPALIAIWTPLLLALKANHPALPSVLVSAITDALLHRSFTKDDDGSSDKDLSYSLCLAAWAIWCVDQWETIPSDEQDENTNALRRRDVMINLVSALAIRDDVTAGARKGSNTLLGLLVHEHPTLERVSKSLIAAAQHDTPVSKYSSADDGLQVMEERLNQLLSSTSASDLEVAGDSSARMDVDSDMPCDSTVMSKSQSDGTSRGWSRVPVESWNPCPIGVFGNG